MKTAEKTLIVLGAIALTAGCVAPGTAPTSNTSAETPAQAGATQPAPAAKATPSATAEATPARVLERPVNNVGDVCYYERTIGYKKMRETRTLSSMTADKLVWDIQTDTGIKGVVETSIVDNGYVVTRDISWANGQDITLTPGFKWIAFPAEPGQAWAVNTDIKGQTFNGTIETELKQGTWEKVKVPAGEFTALRLDMKDKYWNLPRKSDRPDVKSTMTIWTSPETKCLFVELKFSNTAGEKGSARLVASN